MAGIRVFAETSYCETGGWGCGLQEYKMKPTRQKIILIAHQIHSVLFVLGSYKYFDNVVNALKFHDHIFSKLHVMPLINFHLFMVLKICQRIWLLGAYT